MVRHSNRFGAKFLVYESRFLYVLRLSGFPPRRDSTFWVETPLNSSYLNNFGFIVFIKPFLTGHYEGLNLKGTM